MQRHAKQDVGSATLEAAEGGREQGSTSLPTWAMIGGARQSSPVKDRVS